MTQQQQHNHVVHQNTNRGVNAVLDPISEEYMEDALETEDAEVYARGLANYGYQTQTQMRHLVQQVRSRSNYGIVSGLIIFCLFADSA